MLAKVEQKANASPQHLLSNIGELTNLYNAQPQSRRLHRYFSLAGQFSVFRTLGHLNILSAFEKGAHTAAELVIIHGLGEVTVHACLHRLALVL